VSRLLVISNRLPFTVQQTESGPKLLPSSGGLASALSSYLQRRKQESPGLEFAWLGWPGAELTPAQSEQLQTLALHEHGAYPISLDAAEMTQFYAGFCNSTLWPLFHYFPTYATFREEDWETYQRVNERFCEAVLELARPDDEIWVHDYHLLLLPRLLRERLPGASIGFFLHIPFPAFEVFRQLPSRWRLEILSGVLGADLVGFHTHDYVQHFLHSVFRTLGHEHRFGEVEIQGVLTRVEAFPIGIDFERFWQAATSEEVAAARAKIESGLNARQLIFSVDRLDYTKGILHRLRGYEAFLRSYPEFRGKVTFVLVVVPSREEVGQYQRMKQELDELVGQINGGLGEVDWVPVVYQYRTLTFTELVALYSSASVALITPLRDGMNLVAKEFLASKPDGTGVLVLSEMTGAARELGEALQINPNHAREIAEAMREALLMPLDEQISRNRAMQERLRAYDAQRWVGSFLGALERVKERQAGLYTRLLTGSAAEQMLERHRAATRRLLLLDYDGTLVAIEGTPAQAAPDAELMQLLRRLQTPRQSVYVVSGRDRRTLDEWFTNLPIKLVAEHGAWLRDAEGVWTTPQPLRRAWKDELRPLLELYVERVPGSQLEEKDSSLVWHYRRADPELGALRAKELADDVVFYRSSLEVQVLEGKKALEVRNAGVTKGAAARAALALEAPDFVFAAGDDVTDEELFRALPRTAVTVCVGGTHSNANYRVSHHLQLRELLMRLVDD
jgi:trehalose 6-phosphate synthase/phosphatase